MQIFLNLALTLVLSTQLVLPQQSKPRSDSELAAITARGRMLAEYDFASRYATDAVVGLKPAHGVVARNIARKSDGRWVVAFGRFNETKDAFLIVYEATQGGSLEQFSVKTYEPPKNDTGFFYTAAKGIQISLSPRKAALQHVRSSIGIRPVLRLRFAGTGNGGRLSPRRRHALPPVC